jgi:hypothetical protein
MHGWAGLSVRRLTVGRGLTNGPGRAMGPGFLPDLFERWSVQQASHLMSVVLFSRLYFPLAAADAPVGTTWPPLQWDAQGRCYQDVYKVVTDWETRVEWSAVLGALRRECATYREAVLARVTVADATGRRVTATGNACAADGNFLEATNLALNVFEKVRPREGGSLWLDPTRGVPMHQIESLTLTHTYTYAYT